MVSVGVNLSPNLEASRELFATCRCRSHGNREVLSFHFVSIGRTESRPSLWRRWGAFFAHLSYSLRIARLASSFFMLAMQIPSGRNIFTSSPTTATIRARSKRISGTRTSRTRRDTLHSRRIGSKDSGEIRSELRLTRRLLSARREPDSFPWHNPTRKSMVCHLWGQARR